MESLAGTAASDALSAPPVSPAEPLGPDDPQGKPDAETPEAAQAVPSLLRKSDWDPHRFPTRQPSKQCLRRVQRDLAQVLRDPVPGAFVFPDENESTAIHCLLAGNEETPYEGGMFYFYLSCPDDYPLSPPRVKLVTTGGGSVGFNPNLYPNGKVCLSILHTWTGPGWQPVHSLASVLVSIQSLMHDRPYHNEPGYEQERHLGDVSNYNDTIRYQTLQHAVLGMMRDAEAGRLPQPFSEVMDGIFLSMFEGYEESCEDNMSLDGTSFRCPFGINKGTFSYKKLLAELRELRPRVEERADAPIEE